MTLIPQWLNLSPLEFRALNQAINWQEEELKMFGRTVKVPREICWIGDADAHYRYSGVDHVPLPWPDQLAPIRDAVQQACNHSFNSVLANRYRSGADSMGWHSDNEPELGVDPLIASVSLGEARRFRMRHRYTRATWSADLGNGDLLIMAGATQRFWQHQITKTTRDVGERINLTFRLIHTSG